jgi:hypothetical protein
LFDRQVGRLRAAQDLVEKADDLPVTEANSRSIGEQPTILRNLAPTKASSACKDKPSTNEPRQVDAALLVIAVRIVAP